MHPSPLRSISNQQSAAYPDLAKEATAMRHDLNQKDYELYERDRLQRQHENAFTPIQTLEGDKVQWIKKMNALLVEKDRLMQEKTDLAAQLQETRLRCDDFERKWQQVGRKQASEKLISGDLKVEREENARFRDVIHALETERAELRAKLRDIETMVGGQGREKAELVGKLQQKMDHIALLESDNRALQEQIRNMKVQFSDFDLERAAQAHDRSSLREAISRLEADKAEALVRISELSVRYENYVQAIGNEKTSIEWKHRRAVRGQATRTVHSALLQVIGRRLHRRFEELKEWVRYGRRKTRKARDLGVVVVRLARAAEKSALDRWRSSLDWPRTEALRTHAVAHYYTRSRSSACFQAWKAFAHSHKSTRSHHKLSLSRLFALSSTRITSLLRRKWGTWARLVASVHARDQILQSLIYRGSVGKLRDSLRVWRGSVRRGATDQAKEDISTVLSSTLLLQSVLSAWKTLAARSKAKEILVRMQQRNGDHLKRTVALHELKRYLDKRKQQQGGLSRIVHRTTITAQKQAFDRWKQERRQYLHTEAMAKVFTRQHYKRYNTVLEKVFLAWKSHHLGSRLTAVSAHLTTETLQRQGFEAELHSTKAAFHKEAVVSALRLATKRLTVQLQPFLQRWHSVCRRTKASYPVMRRFTMTWYWKKQETAFRAWKSLMLNTDLASLYGKNQALASKTETLEEHVSNLERVLVHREDEKLGITQRRLGAALRLYARFQQRDALRKWGRTALVAVAKTYSGGRIAHCLGGVLYSRTFQAVQVYALEQFQRKVRTTRLHFLDSKSSRAAALTTFAAWKDFHSNTQRQRLLLRRNLSRMNGKLTAVAVDMWRSAVVARKQGETGLQHRQLAAKNEDLTQELSEAMGKLSGETEKNEEMSRKQQKTAQMRLGNAIVRLLSSSQYRSWALWKDSTALHAQQRRKTAQLGKVFHKQELRFAVRIWQFAASKSRKTVLLEQISVSQRDLKDSRRQLKATQEDMTASLAAKSAQLSAKEGQMGVLETQFAALLGRIVKEQENEYSLSKAGYVFKYWSNRYRLLKASLSRLTVLVQKATLRDSLSAIRGFAQAHKEYTSFARAIGRWMEGFSTRQVRNGLDLWRKQAKERVRGELQDLLAAKSAVASQFQALFGSQKEKAGQFAYDQALKMRKLRTIKEWKRVTDKMRKEKKGNATFEATIRLARLKLGLNTLNSYKAGKLVRAKKVVGARFQTETTQKRKIFAAIYKNAIDFRRLDGIFTLLERRFTREGQLLALSAIYGAAHVESLQKANFSSNQSTVLRRLLANLCSSRLSKGFQAWHYHTHSKAHSQAALRRTTLRALHRKYQSAWALWKEHQAFLHLSQYFVSESPLATENQMLKHRVEIYSGLVSEEGIDPEYVEKYVLERESLAEALKRKGISRLRYAAGMTEKAGVDQTSVLPRAFLTWKVYLSKRKKVKRLAGRMRAYRNNPCMSAFRTWKRGLPLVRSTLATYTRTGLLSLIAKMDRDIKTMEGMVETHSKRLSYMQIYSSLLEQHTRRGRNQSLIFLRQQVRSPLAQAMARWNSVVTAAKLDEAQRQVVSLDDAYHGLALKYDQLEQDYTLLFDENSELRQATMDGLDLADAIETLSKERERLSVDLAERAATIKQLLEENNELAARMRAAQKEAEALRVLTVPERERRYD